MLLGSSIQKHLDFRKKVAQEMADIGFKNVLIMEEIVRKKNLDFSSLDDKFEWIVEEFKPTLFLALFHKNVKNLDDMIFEIGWLCGRLSKTNLKDRSRFMFENGYNLERERTTAYIPALFNSIYHYEFYESKPHDKCSEWIRSILVSLMKRKP